MKLRHKLITLLCALALLCSVVPSVVSAKAPGGDFAWTSGNKEIKLKILRTGLHLNA